MTVNGNGGWRTWMMGALMAASMGVGGWYGKTVWATQSSHAERITRSETRIDAVHETLQDMKRTLERVDRRTERLWERAR
mgnify:CR=1 FL=1